MAQRRIQLHQEGLPVDDVIRWVDLAAQRGKEFQEEDLMAEAFCLDDLTDGVADVVTWQMQ